MNIKTMMCVMNIRKDTVMATRIRFGVVLCSMFAISSASAVTRNWDGDTSAIWGTAGNWDTAPNSSLTADIANFNLATYGGNPAYAPNAGTTSINGITIGSGNGVMTLTTVNLSIGTSGITIANGAGAFTISGTTTIGESQVWTNNSTSLFTFGTVSGVAGKWLEFKGSGNMTGSGVISGLGSGGFTYSGSGKLTLNGANTYSGLTTVNSGTLAVTGGGQLYSTLSANKANAITINSGGTIEFDNWIWGGSFGSLWFPSGNFLINGGTLRYVGTTANGSSDRAFTIGANGATLEAGKIGENWVLTTGTYTLASSGGWLTLTGIGNGQIDKIIPGSGGLYKTGTGTWTLSGANTYIGGTTVNDGQLNLNGTIKDGAITVSGGSFTERSTGVIAGSGSFTMKSSGGATLSGTNTYSGSTTVTNGLLAITGGGKIYSTLGANKPNAVTINSGGVVAFDNWAWHGNFGTMWYGSANIVLNGGTLRYVGATGTADGRSLTIGALGATLESTTAGQTWQIAVTDITAVSLVSSTGGLLTLTGDGNGKIDQKIPGTGGLTKTGNGTWTLTGTNTYTGTTTINGGNLKLGATNVLAKTAQIVIGDGTLDAGIYTNKLATLKVTTANAKINLGSGGALEFADSRAIDWTGGKLTITGAFVNGSSIRFSNSNGLTETQLGQISITGFALATIDSRGYLVGKLGTLVMFF